MSGRLAGKTALITAAGQGIGHATAHGDGARRRARLRDRREAATAREVLGHGQRDDTRARRARRCRDRQGSPTKCRRSISCSTARATSTTGRFSTATPKDWEFSFNLNVRAMYMTIRCTLPKMLAKFDATGRGASIINMASIALEREGAAQPFRVRRVQGGGHRPHQGRRRGFRALGASAATRSAPAPSTRRRSSERINAFPDPVEARKMFVARQPMGRLAKAEEIAPLVVFLASDEAAFITGNMYSVRRRNDYLRRADRYSINQRPRRHR